MADYHPAITAASNSFRGELSGEIGNRFVIIRRLGAGGMGEVYCAQDKRLNKQVAIKRLSASLKDDPQCRSRFLREAERAAQLVDRNIAGCYDVVEDDGELLLIMEYVQGQTLRHRLELELTIDEFLNIAVQCASGLAGAHEHGVLHCDLKPENIMLTPSGQAKLLDFGLARLVPRPTDVTASVSELAHVGGTSGYTAPEVLCERPVDARSDIFSLGVVFYEMLTRSRPFQAETAVGVAARILQDEPAPPQTLNATVPAELERTVLRMLRKDPRQRYGSASDLLEDLRRQRNLRSSNRQAEESRRPWLKLESGAVLIALLILILLVPLIKAHWSDAIAVSNLPQSKHLAVLPFQVVGADQFQKAFSEGLAATLSAKLAALSDRHSIDIAAPGEVREQRIKTAQDAYRAFGANLVVEGDVLWSGDAVRITYSVTDPATQRQLRADSIVASASDPFGLEDRVAQSALKALDLELNAQEMSEFGARGTVQPAAYDFYLQGRGYLQDFDRPENLRNAILVFENALKQDPNFAPAYAGLGEVYWQQFLLTHEIQWVDLSLASCQKALTLAPAAAETLSCLGNAYNGTGRYEQAAQYFQKAIERSPRDDAAYRGLADSYHSLGRSTEAEQVYRRAITLRPNYWALYNYLGQFYFKEGRYRDAEQEFVQVTRLQPDNVRGLSNLGAMQILGGRYQDAIATFQRAVNIRPGADAYSNLGVAYFYSRRYAEAADAYTSAAQLEPRNYLIHGNLGDCYYWMPGRRSAAEDAYRKAIDLIADEQKVNPRDASLLIRLARFHAMLDEKEAALRELAHGLTLRPKDPQLSFEIALVYERTGNRTQAFTWLGKSLAAGFSPASVRDDPAFQHLHNDPRFQRLIVPAAEH